MVWDAFKAVTRGECISAIKAARRDHNAQGELLLNKEGGCAGTLADSLTETNYTSLMETRRLVSVDFSELGRTEIGKRAESIFAQGDKNGKLLALLAVD